jgi:hypothetical protein
MAAKPAAPLKMKLLIDTKSQRVLYAEAGKDVVDFLFSFLALPLGAVSKLLTAGSAGAGVGSASPLGNDPAAAPTSSAVPVAAKLPAAGAMVGSVGNLHRSVEALDACHVSHYLTAAPPNGRRQLLYRCKGCSCSPGCYNYATSVRGTPCPVCKAEMATEVHLVEPKSDGGGAKNPVAAAAAGEGSGAGYVRDMVTYTVMDDLSVAPMSTIGAVTALAALGVADISGLQAKTVEIGYKEVILLCILTTIGLRTWRLACVVCVPKFIHAFLIDQCQWAGFGVAQGVAAVEDGAHRRLPRRQREREWRRTGF